MNPFKILTFAGALMTASVAAAAMSGEETSSLYLYHNNSVIYAVEAAQVDSIAWEENGTRVSLYDAEGTQLFTSGIERVDSLSTNLHTPKADILDVVFNEDGTATDISPMANEIRTFASDKLKTYYNPTYGRYAAHFDNPWAGAASGYYRIDYQNNDTFKKALENGHTLEVVVMADEVNNSEAKFFSSHQAGGTGLMICNKNDGRKFNSFTFLPNVSESDASTWRWANSNVQPVPQQYYHIVAVYDKEAETASIYVDGELKSSAAAKGNFRHAAANSQWFGIGCDPGGDKGEQAWHGDVVLARIYDSALTAYDAKALYDNLLADEKDPEETVLPKADVLDIVFNADGTATDISAMANDVTTVPSDRLYTYYSPAFGGYVAHFNNDYAGLATGYYRVDYKDNDTFKKALEDGHTLEAIFMADMDVPNTEAKFFSSHGAGGTGLMICNKNDGRTANAITFLPNVTETGGSSWRWANSGVVPQKNVFYHVVAVYDKEAQKARIYVNGVLKGEGNAPGNYRHPDPATLHWFGIGCDPGTRDGKTVGEQSWHGDVAMARIYDKALTADDAANLWKAVKSKIEYKEPELATNVRLYSFPVIPGKTYTIFGNGFESTDRLEMTTSANAPVEVSATVTEKGLVLTLPEEFSTGTYRFVLHRGEQQQTLGNATLTVVESMPKGAEIIAHRGHWTAEGAVQNSRASLQAAMDINAYGSETDVWITTDDHLMINHDRTFNGVTICESTYDQCKDLTLGNGEKMPQLQDFLDMVKSATDNETRLVIEVKDHGTKTLDDRAAEATVKAVEEAGMKGDEKIKYISFSQDACKKIIALEPEAEVAFICANANSALTPQALHNQGYHGFDYEIGLLRNNLRWIREAHDLGMIVNVWTVNSASDIIEMMRQGVDFVTTNDPETGLDIKAHFDANQPE